jgi:HlyD family secretion protein
MAENATTKMPVLPRKGFFRRWRVLILLILILVSAAVYFAFSYQKQDESPEYSIETVSRGDIVKTITAVGTLEPLVTVQVGSQVSGTIAEIGVDFNDKVKKGQVIARLDQDIYKADLDQSRANLKFQESALQGAEANLEKIRAARQEAERVYLHTKDLQAQGISSSDDLEVSRSQFEQTKAQYNQALAQVSQSKAQLEQSRAAVQSAEVRLEKTVIASPIDGVVISRDVDVGQTVAASLQAPTLFRIANDLTKMQLLANIDEADVGNLQPESEASFTVDAYPDTPFHCSIHQIRMNPETVQNVVTYTAVLYVDNPDLKLLPGMTANITIKVAEVKDALRLPNAALRFKPKLTAEQRESLAKMRNGGHEGSRSGQRRPEAGASSDSPQHGTLAEGTKSRMRKGGKFQVVWVPENGSLSPAPVRLGLTDGVYTQILGGKLEENSQVAVQGTGNRPFTMPFSPFGGRRR